MRILLEAQISLVPAALSGYSNGCHETSRAFSAVAECTPSAKLSAAMASKVAYREAMVAWHETGLHATGIAHFLLCSPRTVRRWIHRNTTTGELLDRPRTGRPETYTEETRLRVVAVYCQTQPLPNCGRWTLRWAARHLLANPEQVSSSPSKSTIHRALQRNRLKPHQSKYFLHITDPDFFPKMDHLIGLYRDPPANLIFFDESPGIQILSRLVPDMRTDGMRIRLEEFEYIRNGRLDVFAFLNHADGKVYLECQADHTTETLVKVFRRQVRQLPEDEKIHYVMDNLSTHRTYQFCQLVAELSQVECPSPQELCKVSDRVRWLGREDKRIVIHFTPFHGSWLNLIEIWFSIMAGKVLGESFASPDGLRAALNAFVDEWNTLLGHPFRWSYDGKGLHEKAVQRFIKIMRVGSAVNIDTRIMTKQMMLLANLLADYCSEVSVETWNQLALTLQEHRDCITGIIAREEGPRRKEAAQQALAVLTASVQEFLHPVKQCAA